MLKFRGPLDKRQNNPNSQEVYLYFEKRSQIHILFKHIKYEIIWNGFSYFIFKRANPSCFKILGFVNFCFVLLCFPPEV